MMDRYSVIVVADETAPVRRFDVARKTVRQAAYLGAGLATLLLLGLVDYVRVRIDQSELESLRVEVVEQRAAIAEFDETLAGVRAKLTDIGEFERKVRIIANLPGSAATGGEEVVEVAPETGVHLDAPEMPIASEIRGAPDQAPQSPPAPDGGATGERDLQTMQIDASSLDEIAEAREMSLAKLADELESKREHLASTPAIWPAKGWLTSRFGSRVSPFTGRKQFHAGIDIAGQRGTDIVAPAEGRVVFAGKRGPLGRSLIIDHGYGIRTLYGHTDELLVKRGERVTRGQRIAALGSTGRSTGPHLHYVVEVEGRAVDPLDYIFD